MNPPTTEQALAQITDEGVFERLATAVLREAAPQYNALLHPGINLDGKTIKSPVDGIAFIDDGPNRRMLAAHHTTTKLDGLRAKWLHAPIEQSTPSKRKSKDVPGDIAKTINLLQEYRAAAPVTEATLILTTNQEPGPDLIQAAELLASADKLSLDIWSRSRLAHFLDHNPQGQWLRHKFLQIDAERLSWELLCELSAKSIEANHPPDQDDAWIARSLDQLIAANIARRLTFVIAQSGHGKTIACYKTIRDHIDGKGAGLIVSDETVANSLTLESAITATLQILNPLLPSSAGADAVRLATPDKPLYIMIEDINRSGRAAQLSEKIASWGLIKGKNELNSNLRILCPLWPGILSTLTDNSRNTVSSAAIFSEGLSNEEGRLAIQRRSELAGQRLSDLEASAAAGELGNDPLLIALYNPALRARTSDPVAQYVETEIQRCANIDGDYTPADFRAALSRFCETAMERCNLSPKWSEVQLWQEIDAPSRILLSRLGHAASLIQLVGRSTSQGISYRHDRVRDRIFADAVIDRLLTGNFDSHRLDDPYFAGILAIAAADPSVEDDFVETLKTQNPLALFIAIRALPEISPRRATIVAAAAKVIDNAEFQGSGCNHLRWQSLYELAETDGKDVLPLVSRYRESQWTAAWQARFRNGDVAAAVALCRNVEPGTGAPWRDVQIEHAKLKFGRNLVTAVAELLLRTDLDLDSRIGVVRLAGHLADQRLLDGLKSLWAKETQLSSLLDDYLWAFAECAPPDASLVLKEPCDRWGELPEKIEGKEHSSPINELASHNVRWAFQHWVPKNAIAYFVERAQSDPKLLWPITYMLTGIDSPSAVLFTVREAGCYLREASSNNSFSLFADHISRDWHDLQERCGKAMSPESREALRQVWMSPNEDSYVQKIAIRVWAASTLPGDLEVLCMPNIPDTLADEVLRARLKRGDQSAVSLLVEKIESSENTFYWWQFGRDIWSPVLSQCFEKQLERRRGGATASCSDDDYMFAETLIRLGVDEGAQILLRHWDHLQHCKYYIHAALYFATTPTLAAAADALAKFSNNDKPLEHILMHFGIRTKGHAGITRLEQFEGLVPYLNLLTDSEIRQIWEECNERGWTAFREAHVDSLYRAGKSIIYLDEEPTLTALDEMVAGNHIHWLDRWLERFAETGATTNAILDTIENWARNRADMNAIVVLADAIIQIGLRPDIDRLNILVEGHSSNVAKARQDALFAVQRRTLQ